MPDLILFLTRARPDNVQPGPDLERVRLQDSPTESSDVIHSINTSKHVKLEMLQLVTFFCLASSEIIENRQ